MQAPLPAPPAQPAACVGSVRGLFWRASQRTGICIPALPSANGRLPCKRKHAIIARFLFAARFARYARYLKQKLFRGTPPPGRAGGFHNSPPSPKNNRLGRFAFPGDFAAFRPFAARTPRGMALIQFLKERLVTFAGHGAAASFSERKQDANPARFNARRRIRTAVCCAAAPRLPPSSIPPHRTDRAAARRETELGETARRVGQKTGEGASRSRPGAAATVSQTPHTTAFPATGFTAFMPAVPLRRKGRACRRRTEGRR